MTQAFPQPPGEPAPAYNPSGVAFNGQPPPQNQMSQYDNKQGPGYNFNPGYQPQSGGAFPQPGGPPYPQYSQPAYPQPGGPSYSQPGGQSYPQAGYHQAGYPQQVTVVQQKETKDNSYLGLLLASLACFCCCCGIC